MAYPPPEDPSGLPQPLGDVPQPLLPPDESPHLLQPAVVQLVSCGDPAVHPHLSSAPSRPPLVDLCLNGEPPQPVLPMSGAAADQPSGEIPAAAVRDAAAKKAPPSRSFMEASHRKFKKRKNVIKTHPFHHSPIDEAVNQTLRKVLLAIRENLVRHDRPAVVQPLKSVAAEDISLSERDDDSVFSEDDEDEEVFDLESYHVDERKRAELSMLMEKYDVYDEEQLRLAIRRERKNGDVMLSLAGNPHPFVGIRPNVPLQKPVQMHPPQSH